MVYIFFVTKTIHKDNCDRKSAEKKCLSSYFIGLYGRQNCPESNEFVRLDSGREPNLLGSESDMYTVHAWSKICPCMPPRTRRN